MSQDRLKMQLSSLERKLKLLVIAYETATNEIQQLRNEKTELKNLLKTKEDQLVNFQNQIKIGKIVESIDVGGDSSELKERIDEYIREIDRCIEHLSK
ncbi:MAG: hypothetical protein OEX22_01065 [Cyclobacteriaceae bacterium]|nr:hypothetical protein [Cyclobacteriaceae bacterium]